METRDLANRITRDWPAGKTIANTAQLTAAGLGPQVLKAARSCGLLFRIRHGVYIRMVEWQQRTPWEQDMLMLRAHALATHSNACYSHLSAARLLGLRVWNAGREIHVSSPSSLSATSKVRGVTVHRRTVAPEQLMRIRHRHMGMVRLTSLEQTIVDCARTAPFVTAVIIGDSGLHQGARLDAMLALLGTLAGHRGVAAARKVIAALDIGSESAGETRTRLLISGMDIPAPEYQVRIIVRGNAYRVDGAWWDIKLALEFDGKTKYFDFKPTEEVIYEERLRERELMEAGWSFIRVVWADLADPELLRRRIKSAMANAQRRMID
ncbi:type IV toxin-antitoxin system AbiEi family antitoxin domain-containing protein [Arthrobacter alpinus]|nr:type IV toxin-antitoxin system AbiEi family antitoxin domain-containing protein [Arthrobacter alpinus]